MTVATRYRNPCKNALSDTREMKNPRKIWCFPQGGGYKIGPAGIKSILVRRK
jgi:hypothetical protein